MRPLTKVFDEKVELYLRDIFGPMNSPRIWSWQGSDGVFMPPEGAVITVVEPLQTAHPSSGIGLDKNNCIPPGVYRVGYLEPSTCIGDSRMGYLFGIRELKTENVFFCAGYREGDAMDWTGVKKYMGELPASAKNAS